MASLFDYDPNGARQQSLFAALLAASPQLMAAGAPSTQPGAWGRGIGAFGPSFIQAQQGYMNTQQNAALRSMQMKKMEQEILAQENWNKMFDSSGQGAYDTQGGEMLSEPKQGLFSDIPSEAKPLIQAMGPKAGGTWLLGSKYDTPSAVKVAEWYRTATPDQKAAMNYTLRAPTVLNLGDRASVLTPGNPASPAVTYEKGIPPQDQPAVRGAQAEAKTVGEAQGKRQFNMMDIGSVISTAESYLTGKATGKMPTASGIGSIADKAAGFFGKSPEGAAEADALRAISGALTAKMPRMEGPQSDKDTMMYREMAGQIGDDSIPVERRLQALREVKRLWQKYERPQGQPAAPQAAGADPLGLFK